MVKNKQFSTSNLYLASSLMAAGFQLDSLRGDMPKQAIFVFNNSKDLQETVDAYWRDSLRISARLLLQEQKTLKDRLWMEKK